MTGLDVKLNLNSTDYVQVKVRISLTGLDVKLNLNSTDYVQVKVRISLTGLDVKLNLNSTDYVQVKVRISLTGLDVKLNLNSTDTISAAKKKLAEQEELPNDSRQRWYYGGKLLGKIFFKKFLSINGFIK